MSNLKFYEIADAYAAVLSEIDEAGGELSPDLESRLDTIEDAATDKADAIAGIVRSRLATAEAYEAEAKRLMDHARAAKNAAEGLKGYLKRTLETMGLDRIEGRRFKIRIQRNSVPSIRWTDNVEALPSLFRKVVVEPDMEAARAVVKSGGALPDGFDVVLGTHLRIQ